MLITADRVLAGPERHLIHDGAVLIRDGVIACVGPREEVQRRSLPGEPRLAHPGATLLPGLIDAHVHLCFDAGTDPVATLRGQEDGTLLADMQRHAEQLLAAGVTTARDLGDRNHLAIRLSRQITEGAVAGPRIVSAGIPVTPPGGHCWFLGGEVSGSDAIRALVQRNSAAGAQVIKVMETGGGLTKGGAQSWETQFAPADLAALVDEAHQAGLPVAAHAHGTDGIVAAVEAGVDTIEHCSWMTATGFEVREDVLARIVEKGIRVCPTVSPDWRMLPKAFGAERAEAMFGAVRRMAEAGVRLIAGTDAGVQRAGFDGLPTSLGFYEHLGLPAERIIAMATSEAADALGLGDVTGRITTGHSADLLVVDGDPLADLAALKSVRTVVAAGKHYQPGRTV
ncbi:amidohydrolase family protein [Streptomyces sp. VRA16 Mangrove soil]|uniref:amidohydrolase family protein n=1 Tax=Streptomyces sp. VRA16 Mangrove soil TaxID=2817434 RepID=UPI001A9DCE75|nr:amidohydrolase family protein [Streptomyces sp. VRA16 Mangrove soil]MBO1330754.1 amidohydrolase family protein [Streptomyces sp. VRA16 Mangrove soil]